MTVTAPHTVLYIADLSERATLAEARAAVGGLVRECFGDGAVLSHHPSGRPYVEGFDGTVSVSHGACHAVLAVSADHVVGVDVEAPRRQLVAVARRFLGSDERRRLESTELTPESLLPYWTAKEAVYKAACTEGLPLTSIDVSVADCQALAMGRTFDLTYHRLPHGALMCVAIDSGRDM